MRGLGIILKKSDTLYASTWTKRTITKQEREKMRRGDFITKPSELRQEGKQEQP